MNVLATLVVLVSTSLACGQLQSLKYCLIAEAILASDSRKKNMVISQSQEKAPQLSVLATDVCLGRSSLLSERVNAPPCSSCCSG